MVSTYWEVLARKGQSLVRDSLDIDQRVDENCIVHHFNFLNITSPSLFFSIIITILPNFNY